MEVALATKEFLAAKAGLSPWTLRMYKSHLTLFADWCQAQGYELETLTAKRVRAFIDLVSRRIGPGGQPLQASSVRGYTTDIKNFLAWAAREDDLDVSLSPTIAARIESPPVEIKVIQTFTDAELARLFRAVDAGVYAVRDKAILSVLTDTGCRASELVGLTLDSVWLDPEDSYILVRGKGKKQREIGLGRVARLALRRYITRYRKPAKAAERRVFIARGGLPLTASGLSQVLVEIGKRAGVPSTHPHRFRHHFACQYLLNQGDVFRLSRLLGHTSIRVTQRYLGAISAKQARQGGHSVLDHLKDS